MPNQVNASRMAAIVVRNRCAGAVSADLGVRQRVSRELTPGERQGHLRLEPGFVDAERGQHLFGFPALGGELDAGEGLDGTAGRCHARGGLQLCEELVR